MVATHEHARVAFRGHPTRISQLQWAQSFLVNFQLQGYAHGELVYIYQASRGSSPVFSCDLSRQPPAWTLIHDSIVGQSDYADIHGRVIDLRLDTLI